MLALMYVSKVTFEPLMMTPVTEATSARKSVAVSDHVEYRIDRDDCQG